MKSNIFLKPLCCLLLFVITADLSKAQNCSEELVLQPDSLSGNDAYIADYNPNNPTSLVGWLATSAWTISGTPVKWRTFIQFDWSALPAGAQITKATLLLSGVTTSTITNFGNESHSCLTGDNNAVISRVTTPWNKTTLTWNTQPGTSNLNTVNTPALCLPNQDVEIDVTALINDMVADPTNSFGFQIRLDNETYYRNLVFASSRHSDPAKHPRLTIQYDTLNCICNDNIIQNGNFSEGLVPGDLDGVGNVDFWTEIKNGSGGFTTPQAIGNEGCNENGSLRMWGNQVVGEGVWQAVNFVKGTPYRLQFCGILFPIVQPNARLRFRATNNPDLVQQYNTYNPCQLPECQEIFLSPPLLETWDTYTSPVWTAAENFNTFVITVWNESSVDGAPFVSWAGVDDVCVSLDSFVLRSTEELIRPNALKIAPNPATTSIDVLLENPLAEHALLRLFDLQGKLLKEAYMTSGSIRQSLDVSDLSNGLYILEMQVSSKEKQYGKIIVQH